MIEKLLTYNDQPLQKAFVPETAGELLLLFQNQHTFQGYRLIPPASFEGALLAYTLKELNKYESDYPLSGKWQLPWFGNWIKLPTSNPSIVT